MIKYKLKYKGKLYRVIIRELKYGVISDKKDIGNKIYLIISNELTRLEIQREFHRLIKNKDALTL